MKLGRWSVFSEKPTKNDLLEARRIYHDEDTVVMTAHDHCYSKGDFLDMAAAGITVRTIKLGADNTYWSGGEPTYWVPKEWQKEPWNAEVDYSGPIQAKIHELCNNPDIKHCTSPDIMIVTSKADVLNAKRSGKLGVIIGFEGGSILPPPPDKDGKPMLRCQQEGCDANACKNLMSMYSQGLRDFQPYWGVNNWLKAADLTTKKPRDDNWEHAKLNCFGKVLIREAVARRVVIDLSHMGPKAFEEALKEMDSISPNQPFLLSHASVAAVSLCERGQRGECPTYKHWLNPEEKKKDHFLDQVDGPGNSMMLSDDVLEIVKQHHAVIALHFIAGGVSYFRSGNGEDVTLEDLVNEIDYIREKCGMQCVALGPDYLPAVDPRPWVRGARDMTELINVAIEMVVHGNKDPKYKYPKYKYREPDVKKVLGGNLLRLYDCVWTGSTCKMELREEPSAPEQTQPN